MRNLKLLNDNWRFVKTAANVSEAMTAAAEPVTLPHTWNAVDGQDGGNDYYRGTCWYVRELGLTTLPEDEQVWLKFEGAAMTADVYLNGVHLAHHEDGYSTFYVNLTGHIADDNILVVSVDNSDNDRVYPQKADFTFYGGLYRPVSLLTVPTAHFSFADGAQGLKVTPVVAEDYKSAAVTLEATVENADGQNVVFHVFDQPGNLLCAASSVTPCAETSSTAAPGISVFGSEPIQTVSAPVTNGVAHATVILENVHLWNGKADPFLYTATAALDSGDSVSARFGCRTISFDAQTGFSLNGKPYPLHGVSRHQDRQDLGNAITDLQHEEDMALIKEIGATTVRLAHYQHAQKFYDLCDENGIIAWAEIPYITAHMPNGRANTLSQMRELVSQNYNHPSIVCWGLSNEITASTPVDEDMLENHRLLNDLCHELDATRPTTMADVFMLEIESPILEIPDINSYNLYFGWYLGDLKQNDSFFDEYHSKYPNRVIGFSEYGADANPAFQSSTPQKGDYTETYQCVYHEHILQMIEKRPWLWATHVWNMFDFAADGRDEGGKHGINQKGLVSFDRKLKKDAFYLYKAYWNQEEPFVHLCGSRYIDRAEDVTEIKVYSNLREVSLLVDGKEFAAQAGKHIFTFLVPINGEHTITATGNAGQLTDTIHIRKVAEPNPDYRFGTAGDVTNWFDADELKPDYYSIKDTFGELSANPGTAPIVGRMMEQASASRGDVAKSTAGNQNLMRMMAGMSLESLIKQAGDAVTPEQIKALNDSLQQVKKD